MSARARGSAIRLPHCLAPLLLVIACPMFALAAGPGANDPAPAAATPAAAAAPADTLPDGILHEPDVIAKGMSLSKSALGDGNGNGDNGFYPEFSNMASGAGFVSVGPGYRHDVFGGNGFVDTSAAVSWRFYKMAQARLEFPRLRDDRLTLGVQGRYQDNTQVNYFGIGDAAVGDDQTQYRVRSSEVAGYGVVTLKDWFSFGGELGWLHSPNVTPPGGTFNPGFPYAADVFPTDPAMNLADQPSFLRTELSVMADTLDAHSHPTSGGQYRGAVTSYAADGGNGFTFAQYEAEATQMVPLAGPRLLLGLHAWTVFSTTGDNDQTPFYLMPSIGGHNTLRAYHTYQFRDLNTVTATAELRLALMTHVDVAPFFDAGNVGPRYADLNFNKTSIGAGVRLHTATATVARVDVAHGSEGWRLVARTSDPFKLSRVASKLAQVPFAP